MNNLPLLSVFRTCWRRSAARSPNRSAEVESSVCCTVNNNYWVYFSCCRNKLSSDVQQERFSFLQLFEPVWFHDASLNVCCYSECESDYIHSSFPETLKSTPAVSKCLISLISIKNYVCFHCQWICWLIFGLIMFLWNVKNKTFHQNTKIFQFHLTRKNLAILLKKTSTAALK